MNNKKIKYIFVFEDEEKCKGKVSTEDLGKTFEMAICMLYDIKYDGNYRYSLEEANEIKHKLHKLKDIFPFKIKHVAKKW